MEINFDKSKTTVLVFVGTMLHNVDCISPMIGTLLAREHRRTKGLIILGTTENEINARNANTYAAMLDQLDRELFEVIAIDIGICLDRKPFKLIDRGIRPASGMNKNLRMIGDKSIIIDYASIYGGLMVQSVTQKLMKNSTSKKVIRTKRKRIVQIYDILNNALWRKCINV